MNAALGLATLLTIYSAVYSEKPSTVLLLKKMTAASFLFRVVHEEDSDKALND